MIRVTIEAEVPNDKMLFWLLDWVRTFDKTHEGECHFRIFADGGDQTVDEAAHMLRVLGLNIVFAERKRD